MGQIYRKIHQGSKAAILCIDDDPEWLLGLSEILLHVGYSCNCCRDGEAARASIRRSVPDLIISDIDLGDEDGLLLCEEIRAMPGAAEVPVLFVSGAEIPDVVRRAHDAGAAYYLRKPFDPDVLLDLVEKALWLPHVVRNHIRSRIPTTH